MITIENVNEFLYLKELDGLPFREKRIFISYEICEMV